MEEHGHVVVGVDARGNDDVDFRDQICDGLDAGDVATQPDHGEVDQRVDALPLELLQLGHGTCSFRFFVPLVGGLLDLRAQDEDVLVHEGLSERRSLHWPSHGVDLRHPPPFLRPAHQTAVAAGAIVPGRRVTPPNLAGARPVACPRPLHGPHGGGVTMG